MKNVENQKKEKRNQDKLITSKEIILDLKKLK
jgi:hypothetical protein